MLTGIDNDDKDTALFYLLQDILDILEIQEIPAVEIQEILEIWGEIHSRSTGEGNCVWGPQRSPGPHGVPFYGDPKQLKVTFGVLKGPKLLGSPRTLI
jgi:hypothetical protein